MSLPTWKPTAEQILSVQKALKVYDAIFEAAAKTVAEITWGGLSTRGELRSRLANIMDLSPAAQNDPSALRLVRDMPTNTLAMLKAMRRTRLPAVCASEDAEELTCDDLGLLQTNDVPLNLEDGSIVVRLDGVFPGGINAAATRVLVWDGHPDANSFSRMTRTLLNTLVNHLEAQAGFDTDNGIFRNALLAAMQADGVRDVVVHRLGVSSAVDLEEAPLRRLVGPLEEGVCITPMAVVTLVMHNGPSRCLGVEEPAIVVRGQLQLVRLIQLSTYTIPRFRNHSHSPLWCISHWVSASDTGKNLFHDPQSPTLSQAEGDAIIDDVIRQIYRNLMGFNEYEMAFIFDARRKKVVHRLRPFLMQVMAQQRPDIALMRDLLEHVRQRLPGGDEAQAVFEARSRPRPIRSGPWDDRIDTPALEGVLALVARVCDVFPLDVARYIKDGNSYGGPPPIGFGAWGDAKMSDRGDAKEYFIIGIFDLFAKRSNPWEMLAGEEARQQLRRLRNLVIDNTFKVDINHTTESEADIIPIHWTDTVMLARGTDMLNSICDSVNPIIYNLVTVQNDWNAWSELLNGEHRKSLSAHTRATFDSWLLNSWIKSFPSSPMTLQRLLPRIRVLIAFLLRDEVLAQGYAAINMEQYVALAFAYMMFKRDPSNPGGNRNWTKHELDRIHSILPFVARSAVHITVQRHADQIKRVYDYVQAELDSDGQTVRDLVAPHVNNQTLATIDQFHA